jgi:hypothetical protein
MDALPCYGRAYQVGRDRWRSVAQASRVYLPGDFGVSQSYFQRRHAYHWTGSKKSA